MTDALLSVSDLGISIAGKQVVTNVSLRVAPGEILGIVGESGSGKTMTSRMLTGMLAPIGGRVTSGSATFAATDLTRLDEKGWRRIRGHRISLVPQSSQSGLDPLMTVFDQVIETIEAVTGAEDPGSRAADLLRSVRLDPDARMRRAYPHELSGGMRQRVMIALALAGNAELLIGDEATTALDVTVQGEILALLDQLRRERGLALILITHDFDVVRGMADAVSVMYAGMTVEEGPIADVLGDPRHPYTAALLGAQPRGARRDQPLAAIDGTPPAPGNWPAGCRFAPRCRHATHECELGRPELVERGHGRATACIRSEEVFGE
jgi:oligopeptide/dipeptide ABC transporter ATP-binding protein